MILGRRQAVSRGEKGINAPRPYDRAMTDDHDASHSADEEQVQDQGHGHQGFDPASAHPATPVSSGKPMTRTPSISKLAVSLRSPIAPPSAGSMKTAPTSAPAAHAAISPAPDSQNRGQLSLVPADGAAASTRRRSSTPTAGTTQASNARSIARAPSSASRTSGCATA